MATKQPQGPVATTRAYMDRNTDRIKSGKIVRMDAIRVLEAKGVTRGTAAGTIAKWMQDSGLEWAARSKPGRKAAAS